MALQVEASPKLKPRPSRPRRPVFAAPAEEMASAGSAAPGAMSPAGRILAAAAVLIAAGLLLHTAWGWMHGPDPHYLTARKMVADYELAKPPDKRNYGHRVYGNALRELALVDPDSASAEPAAEMRDDLQQRIKQFQRRMQAREQIHNAALEKRMSRKEAMAAARDWTVRNPVTSYPECEKEE